MSINAPHHAGHARQTSSALDGRAALRIAFLFGHLHRGGMQRAASNISLALPGDWRQYVVYFGSENPDFRYNARMVDLRVPGSEGTGVARKLWNSILRWGRLRRFIRDERIDVVVSFGEIANVLNVLAVRCRRILSVRSAPSESLRDAGSYGGVYRWLMQRLYGRADAVVANSLAIARALREDFGIPARKVRVIHNLFDAAEVERLAAEGIDPAHDEIFTHPVVIAVGALAGHKGHRHLLHAFAAVHRRMPEARLVLVGDGPSRGALEVLAGSLGIAHLMRFVGFDANPHRYVRRASVLVLPSWYEGFPNVVVEAMLCGVPVVATDCETGPREILGDSAYGVLVPRLRIGAEEVTEHAIAAELVRLLSDASTRAALAARARRRAAEFEAGRVMPHWLEVCDPAAAQRDV